MILRFLRRLFGRAQAGGDPLAGLDRAQTHVIVGLGNPGPDYADTRHNVGFRAVEELAHRYGASWHDCTAALQCHIAVAAPDGQPLALVKPQTFMNRSGGAVAAVLERTQTPPERCLVVYDDMDLPFGGLRLRERGSPGSHNGMRSVVSSLGTQAVQRLRIGISQSQPGGATDHVLGEFTEDERAAADQLIVRAADAAASWAIDGAAVAMNRYNKT